MTISRKEVEHVAVLARLDMDEDELEGYTRQLSSILEYMGKLNELDTEGVEPTAHVLPLKNVFRDDEVREGIEKELALKNAPDKKDGQFKVPKIV